MKMILLSAVGAAIALLLVLEIGLRSRYGLGNPLLYNSDPKIGYLIAPNQRTRRNGNLIEINAYSMRSGEITPTPNENTWRVLMVGDSIINGGWWTDQPNTIANLTVQALNQNLSVANHPSNYTSIKKIEVLNASANSWGPRNELAYLEKFGNFGAQVVVLVINTDDLFAIAPYSVVVGRDRNYPNQKPPLALIEAYQRYIQKPQPIPELEKLQKEPGDRVGNNLEAIKRIKQLTRQQNSQFILLMTPLKRELGKPGPRDYEIIARNRISEFSKQEDINYIDILPVFNNHSKPESLYHDHIHLNLQGNQVIVDILKNKLSQQIGKPVIMK